MVKSKLDQVIESYVTSKLNDEEKKNLSIVSRFSDALKHELLSDVNDGIISQMREEATIEVGQYKKRKIAEAEKESNAIIAEAKKHKKTLVKKAKRSLIYETILVALLVGIVVNQITSLLPKGFLAAAFISIIALLICNWIIHAETGKD